MKKATRIFSLLLAVCIAISQLTLMSFAATQSKALKLTKVLNVTAQVQDDIVSVCWDAALGADKYIASVFNAEGVKVKNAQTTLSSINFSGVECGEYTVQVIARVDGKWFSYDNADVIKISVSSVVCPSASKVSATYNSINVYWDTAYNAIKYFIKVEGGGITRVYTSSRNSITLKSLSANTEYKVSVCAKTVDGKYTEYGEATKMSTTDYAVVTLTSSPAEYGNTELSFDGEGVVGGWVKVKYKNGIVGQIAVVKNGTSVTINAVSDIEYYVVAKVNVNGTIRYITTNSLVF